MNLRDKITQLTGLEYKYNPNHIKGGDILEPKGEIFKNVIVFDFKSFYSTIIMSYNIFGDSITDFLLKMSDKKDQGDKEAKLIMNSIYGMFKHFDIDKAALVTKVGRKWIRELRKYVEDEGFNVIYSHTDCVMISDINNDFIEFKLQTIIENFRNNLQKGFINQNIPLNICVENEFKYIFFRKNDTGYSKNMYIGVNKDSSLQFSGIKPSITEIYMIDLIKYKLNQGTNKLTTDELYEYTVNSKIQNFINENELSILEVNKQLIEL